MKRSVILNVVGLTSKCLGESMPRLEAFRKERQTRLIDPVLPAVTCTAQATYLTGHYPACHGIVGNGWYDRSLAEVQFWKQSNALVRGPKLWETLRETAPDFSAAKLFWWYNMYASANYSITPRPMYPADGRKVFDVYTHPMGDREVVKEALGDFPFPFFWGPMAGIPSSRWIADSARWYEERYQPDLSLVYLPHLDYDFQRYGPDHPESRKQLGVIDQLVGELLDFFQEREVEPLILSEYGITEVNQPVDVNRFLRSAGWLTVKEELGRELLDPGASQAFAVADHQIAHVYINDDRIHEDVKRQCESIPGVEEVWGEREKSAHGLNHERAGDLILVADSASWFTYYYWESDDRAPDFARCVDIHRKPGYDPAELFLNPLVSLPKMRIGWKLLRKKLGFRMLMDFIPLDAGLVKGSHGRRPDSKEDWPVLIGDLAEPPPEPTVTGAEVHGQLVRFCRRNSGLVEC
ncbi:MAG: nucleotide pyrophosphatase/phosphodiesterase family protein [Verrucomicrobiota bacterium]